MKIFYDHQIFQAQKFGGISRYFVELMSHLPADADVLNSIVFTDNVYLRDANLSKSISLPKFRGRNRIMSNINGWDSIIDLKRNNYDIFHPTYYDPYFLKHLKKPYVITVHDMIHEKFREMFTDEDPTPANKIDTIKNADRIIAISNNTKKDIIDIYGLPENKIDVVYHGHSVNDIEEPVDNIPDDYILFVGQRDGYKNFKRFIQAFAEVNRKYSDIKLVCTGTPFKEEEMLLIKKLGIENEIFRCFVSDAQLTNLYKNAICFVFPSLYEGFGIPILEAFASKSPLVLSNTSCFPEIAGDGGVYFDPYDVESITQSLINVISDSDLRKKKVTIGSEILKLFSWDKMAQETYEVYKKVLS